MPEPCPQFTPPETEDQFRVRLRAWVDTVETHADPVTRQGEWEYLCELEGIGPG